MYLFFIIMSFILSIVSNGIILKRADDEGIIYKSSEKGITLGDIIVFGLHFVPYVNVALEAFVVAFALLIINNDNLWESFISKYRRFPSGVVRYFEFNNVPKETMKECLEIDGAKGLDKATELAKITLCKTNLIKDKFDWIYTPEYSELEYNKAKSIIAAEQMIYEVECNVDLNKRQKAKLLKLFKKAYLKDFIHPEIQEIADDEVEEVKEEPDMVAIGDNNNLVEKELVLEDTLEDNDLYQKVLKIIN